MWTSALRRTPLIVGLSILLVLLFTSTPGRGDLQIPAPAPGKAFAVASARQSAEEIVLEVSATTAALAEAQGIVVQQAIASSQRRAAAARVQAIARAENVSTRSMATRPLPSPTPRPTPATARVPILMYHHIADAPPNADAIRRDLSVSPSAFVKQMDYLRANGYQTISLADLADHLQTGRALPAKPVVLTFDDGYDDNYSQADPILRRYGFSATFFIMADLVGQPGYATWDQIIDMSRHDMAIEAHGRNHADLAASSPSDTAWQVAGSRKILEEKLGRPVRFYCYPSGRYTAQTIAILRANGYVAAVTTAYGATHSPGALFELSRVRIRGADTMEQFAIKVETAR